MNDSKENLWFFALTEMLALRLVVAALLVHTDPDEVETIRGIALPMSDSLSQNVLHHYGIPKQTAPIVKEAVRESIERFLDDVNGMKNLGREN